MLTPSFQLVVKTTYGCNLWINNITNCSVLQEGKIKMFTKLLWQSVLWGRKSENPVFGGLMKWPPEKNPQQLCEYEKHLPTFRVRC